jgi:hypothetical protein
MTFEIFGLELSLGWYIVVFFICSIINVALNTAKTIIMHKEEKISSSIINAITFGFYAIIVVMTASALPLWITILITAITNLIGVYGSMWLLERFKQDSLWEITATIKAKKEDSAIVDYLIKTFEDNDIPFSIIECYNKEKLIFNIYSHNQNESILIKKELDYVGAKYIVHEERVRL